MRFQLKFSLTVFILLCASTAFLYWFGHLYVVHLADVGLITDTQIPAHQRTLAYAILQTGVFSLIFVFGVVLAFSHFIAEPVHRLEKVLEEVRKGNLDVQVPTRPYDELKDLIRLAAEAISSVRDRFHVLKRRDAEWLAHAEAARAALERQGATEAMQILAQAIEQARLKVPYEGLGASGRDAVEGAAAGAGGVGAGS